MKSADPVAMYLEDIFTVQANLAGIPAVSLPLGKTTENLPFGLQLMSAPFTEPELLATSKKIEDFLTSQRG
jgi:aspartyl-tRNA(Asn)/glutamyl-tRNA(Gln) amidotransferase subunit A